MGIRIDALSSTSLPTATHELPAMKDGITVKLTVEQIAEAGLKDQPLKEMPVDTDGIALVDSEGGIKRLSWSKLRDAFLSLAGGTMTGLLTLAPSDDDPDGTASLNIPAGADTPDVQADGDIWADSNEDLRYRRGGEDATVYDTVNLPRPEPGEMAAGTETSPRALSAADVRAGVRGAVVRSPSVATTSGTAFDFAIDPTATQIVVLFDRVALSGTDVIIVQLETAAGIVTAGYDQASVVMVAGSNGFLSSAAGFSAGGTAVARRANGRMVLTNLPGTTTWVASNTGGNNSTTTTFHGGGSVDAGGDVVGVRLTRTGTNTFNNGNVAVEYRA